MRETYILGVSMTRFGKQLDKSLKDLAYEPVWNAIRESQIDPHDIDIAFVGNAYAGLITGQESIRGQVVLRDAGITKIPIINVENACASGSTAFFLAHRAVASGQAELALAVGVEKLFCDDTGKSLKVLGTSSDLDIEGKMGILFAGIYAMRVRAHMEKYGLTLAHLHPQTQKQVQELSPDWMPITNPVDYWPAMEKNGPALTYKSALSALHEDPGVDGIIVHIYAGHGIWLLDPKEILSGVKGPRVGPCVACLHGKRNRSEPRP